MIRPEAAATLMRWREALVGGAAVALGLWLALSSRGLPALFGAAAAGVGAVLLLSGVLRARMRTGTGSPGLVEMDEGRITYLGPMMGGSVAIEDLDAVTFRRTATGEAFWRLSHDAGPPLLIPDGAAGAERLFDALVLLPGLDAGALVRATRAPAPATSMVWRRTATEPSRRRLT